MKQEEKQMKSITIFQNEKIVKWKREQHETEKLRNKVIGEKIWRGVTELRKEYAI